MALGTEIALIKALGGNGGGGTGGGVLVVHDVNGTLDKTWQEINESSVPIMIQSDTAWYFVTSVRHDDGGSGVYIVVAIYSSGITVNTHAYVSASASGYPTFDLGGGGNDHVIYT